MTNYSSVLLQNEGVRTLNPGLNAFYSGYLLLFEVKQSHYDRSLQRERERDYLFEIWEVLYTKSAKRLGMTPLSPPLYAANDIQEYYISLIKNSK